MHYQSTRSNYTTDEVTAVLHGIAPDGGLFICPELDSLKVDLNSCISLSYKDLAEKIIGTFFPGFKDSLGETVLVYDTKFASNKTAPLIPVGEDYILELFHGPTSAFKDFALTVLPRLITASVKQEGLTDTVSILTATSGDTGKAALSGFCDVPGTEIIVFFPDGGVSKVQRAQMVTQEGKNVRVCAVRGNFDDCQRGVKETFAKLTGNIPGKLLSSANSINIGRLIPQVVYYYSAYCQLVQAGKINVGDKVDFVVPTGNFGDILAGYFAKKTGLPVGKLVCASNDNKILCDFLHTGVYDTHRPFMLTTSPSMDILVSSNLERLLYYAMDGNTELVAACMKDLNEKGIYTLREDIMNRIRENFSAGWCSQEDCANTISEVWNKYHYLCDPHTAVAYNVMKQYKKENPRHPCVVLSTASPFKFPASVLKALGTASDGDDFALLNVLSETTGLAIPENLASLKEKEELHKDCIDQNCITSYVQEALSK